MASRVGAVRAFNAADVADMLTADLLNADLWPLTDGWSAGPRPDGRPPWAADGSGAFLVAPSNRATAGVVSVGVVSVSDVPIGVASGAGCAEFGEAGTGSIVVGAASSVVADNAVRVAVTFLDTAVSAGTSAAAISAAGAAATATTLRTAADTGGTATGTTGATDTGGTATGRAAIGVTAALTAGCTGATTLDTVCWTGSLAIGSLTIGSVTAGDVTCWAAVVNV